MKRTSYRQGDVFLQPVETLPQGLVATSRDEHDRIVLAHGETSGHAHAIRDRDVAGFRFDTAASEASGIHAEVDFITVGGSASLNHELVSGVKAEHEPVGLSGSYRVIQQREYSPEAVRRVAD
jgi:hypothetical protein